MPDGPRHSHPALTARKLPAWVNGIRRERSPSINHGRAQASRPTGTAAAVCLPQAAVGAR